MPLLLRRRPRVARAGRLRSHDAARALPSWAPVMGSRCRRTVAGSPRRVHGFGRTDGRLLRRPRPCGRTGLPARPGNEQSRGACQRSVSERALGGPRRRRDRIARTQAVGFSCGRQPGAPTNWRFVALPHVGARTARRTSDRPHRTPGEQSSRAAAEQLPGRAHHEAALGAAAEPDMGAICGKVETQGESRKEVEEDLRIDNRKRNSLILRSSSGCRRSLQQCVKDREKLRDIGRHHDSSPSHDDVGDSGRPDQARRPRDTETATDDPRASRQTKGVEAIAGGNFRA